MTEILDGKAVAKTINEQTKARVAKQKDLSL